MPDTTLTPPALMGHTPGVWRIDSHAVLNGAVVAELSDGTQIAVAHLPRLAGWRPFWEQEGNAHLIAAAPLMLEALLKVWAWQAEVHADPDLDDVTYAAVYNALTAAGVQS